MGRLMVLLLCGGAVLLAARGLPAGEPPAGGGQIAPPPGPEEPRGGELTGRVIAVTADALTIQLVGKPAKRFRPSPALAAGKLPEFDTKPGEPTPAPLSDSYKNVWIDLRVGDWVDVHFSRWDQCDAFRIFRRPGGRVPPVRGEPPGTFPRFHDVMNARQDWEERRVPFPNHLHPGGNETCIAPPPRHPALKPAPIPDIPLAKP